MFKSDDPASGSQYQEAPPLEGASTLEDRIRRGTELGRADEDGIIPFPDGWGTDAVSGGISGLQSQLSSHMKRGPNKSTILDCLNSDWSPRLHRYRAADGSVIFIVLRLDHATEPKKILPLRVSRLWSSGIPIVECRGLAPLRPVFNLDQLAARPDAPVLLVEGEKAAEAGGSRFPDYVASTWPNGAQGLAKVDLQPLAGREVSIWPDNDEPGRRAAVALARKLVAVGAKTVRIVKVPITFPQAWDVAEPWPENIDG